MHSWHQPIASDSGEVAGHARTVPLLGPTETAIQTEPMRIVRVASYGAGAGDCENPHNVLAQWGILHAAIPSGGGGQLAFQSDGDSPESFVFSGRSFVAPTNDLPQIIRSSNDSLQ